MAIAAKLPIDDPQTPRTLIATGALVEALSRRQAEAKLRFVDIFAAFAAPAVRKMVRSLFGPESKARTRGV